MSAKAIQEAVKAVLLRLQVSYYDRTQHRTAHGDARGLWDVGTWDEGLWDDREDPPLVDQHGHFEYLRCDDDLVSTQPGDGLVVRTPDGTKQYRIRVDNSGNVVSEMADA